jgi:hypothetical protein
MFPRAGAAGAEPVFDAEKGGVDAAEDFRFIHGEKAVRPGIKTLVRVRAAVQIGEDGLILPYKEYLLLRLIPANGEAARAGIIKIGKGADIPLAHGIFFSPAILQMNFHSSGRTG